MLFKHCIFRNNTAVIATFNNVTVQVIGCVFDSNRSGFTGVLEGRVSDHFYVHDSIFTRNIADSTFLIDIGLGCTLRVESSQIFENARTSRSLFYGRKKSNLRFTNCTFSHHYIHVGPLLVISGSSLTLLNCTFVMFSRMKDVLSNQTLRVPSVSRHVDLCGIRHQREAYSI